VQPRTPSPGPRRLVKPPSRATLSPGERAARSVPGCCRARRPLTRNLRSQIQDCRQVPRPLPADLKFQIQDSMPQKRKGRTESTPPAFYCRLPRRGGWTVDSAVIDRRYSAIVNRKSAIGNRQ
jgi:hypothetical protein